MAALCALEMISCNSDETFKLSQQLVSDNKRDAAENLVSFNGD